MRAIGNIRRMGIGLALLMLAGCATTDVAEVKKGPGSGFLGRDYALLTPGEVAKGQAGLRYFNPQANWHHYGRVMLEPVTFWGDDVGKVAPADQQALGTYFNGSLAREFGKHFDVVTVPGPGVVRLQVAVVDVEAATPGLRSISLVVPQARVLTAVGSMATGEQVFAGSLQVESRLTDASTGQLLAAAIARGIGGGNVKAAAQVQWGDAQNAMDLFARRAAASLSALTTGKASPADLPLPD
jgi:hypothetical protein